MTSERRDGPTPAGGAYSEAVYMDDHGELCEKEVATQVWITEYDADGKWLGETVGNLTIPADRLRERLSDWGPGSLRVTKP